MSFTNIYIKAKTMMSLLFLLVYVWALLGIVNRISSPNPSS